MFYWSVTYQPKGAKFWLIILSPRKGDMNGMIMAIVEHVIKIP